MTRRRAAKSIGPNIRFRLPLEVQRWLRREASRSRLSVPEMARRLTIVGAWGFRFQHFDGLNTVADKRQLDLTAICETVHEKCRTMLRANPGSTDCATDGIPNELVERCIREMCDLPEQEPEASNSAEQDLMPGMVIEAGHVRPRVKKAITSRRAAAPQIQFWIVRPLRHRLEQLRSQLHITENELARRLVILALWNFPPGMIELLNQAAEFQDREFETVCNTAASVWTMRTISDDRLATLVDVISLCSIDMPPIEEVVDSRRLKKRQSSESIVPGASAKDDDL